MLWNKTTNQANKVQTVWINGQFWGKFPKCFKMLIPPLNSSSNKSVVAIILVWVIKIGLAELAGLNWAPPDLNVSWPLSAAGLLMALPRRQQASPPALRQQRPAQGELGVSKRFNVDFNSNGCVPVSGLPSFRRWWSVVEAGVVYSVSKAVSKLAQCFFFSAACFVCSRQQDPGKLKSARDALVCSPHYPGKARASLGGLGAHGSCGRELGWEGGREGAKSPWFSFSCPARCHSGQSAITLGHG